MWGLWVGGAVVFSTSPESRKGRNLAHDPRVVNLESGDDVVILEGEVESIALADRLADRYEAKYQYRPGGEGGLVLATTERRLRVAGAAVSTKRDPLLLRRAGAGITRYKSSTVSETFEAELRLGDVANPHPAAVKPSSALKCL